MFCGSFRANNWILQSFLCPVREYAARKGTREKREKKKKKSAKEPEVKAAWIPESLRNKDKEALTRKDKKYVPPIFLKELPPDNVYMQRLYFWKVYTVSEAIKCHRETHHPTMYNIPDSDVFVKIELNMQGDKPTRFVDPFSRIVAMPHSFDIKEQRSVIAFAKNHIDQEAALAAGATAAGGTQLIKDIQNGKESLESYTCVLSHPDILAELVALRGLMKRRFPSASVGTLTPDLAGAASKFLNGISYTAIREEYEKDYGEVKAKIGTLAMDDRHLERNMEELLTDVYKSKPKREGSFIDRVLIISPPSKEKFLINHELYLGSPTKADPDALHDDDGEEDAGVREIVGD